MNPKEEAVRILNEGLQFKRQGNFRKAIEYYKSAGQLDPRNRNVYWNQAKTFYILDDFSNSFRNYLKASHATIVTTGQRVKTSPAGGQTFLLNLEMMYGKEYVARMSFKEMHLLGLGQNFMSGIAHAYLDKGKDQFPPVKKAFVNEYKNGLAGQPFELDEELEAEYIRKGTELLEQHITWRKAENDDLDSLLMSLNGYDQITV